MQELNPVHHWEEFCYVPLKSYKEHYYMTTVDQDGKAILR